jgi:hypothetical protein
MRTSGPTRRVFEAERVQQIIGKHMSTIVDCHLFAMHGWNEHAQRMSDLHPLIGPGARGQYMHDLAVAEAKRRFVQTDVVNTQFQQVEFFDFGKGLLLRFKQPGNRDTKTARGLANQLWLIPEIAEADPDCQTIVEAEYTLDPSGTQIARVSIACVVDTHKAWSYSIYNAKDASATRPPTLKHTLATEQRKVRPLKKLDQHGDR